MISCSRVIRSVTCALWRPSASHVQVPGPYFLTRNLFTSCIRDGIYTPEDLPPPGPPTHPPINIRLRGYDFTVLEHYMYYLSKMAHYLGVTGSKRWATPATTSRITTFKAQSSLVENDYELHLYDRTVQLSGMTAPIASLILDVVNSTLPEGITVTVKVHEEAEEEIRYIPDYELVALKNQLEDMNASSGKKP
ncbi:hypothetical protein RvY_09526 [Ramazzottius varieornatus]|uniref:Small ribosomal subunit protein uS10 domain-containing protein n=1 Tax=Ramazzottius varieornatus TaxID=947166 RepID=A0A1D1V9K8_RAMVA|nr:hypothetical protein RvY_09526 [Ramazzottius varieornatus]